MENAVDRKKDIEFLERFRERIDKYLFLGYAPPMRQSASDYNAETLRQWEEALQTKPFQELRRAINLMIPQVKKLFLECNVTPWLEQHPPPAIGGPVLRFEIVDLIFQNTAEGRIPKSLVLDAIDRAIGMLEAWPRKSHPTVGTTTPWVNKTGKQHFVFVSHSSKDAEIVAAVKQAFDDLPCKPYFVEAKPVGMPPAHEIAQAVRNAAALFVFFTYNSISGETRDWIVFELGAAVSQGRDVYSWKQRGLAKEQLPRVLEQVITHREFEVSTKGIIELAQEIRAAAKGLQDR